MTQTTPIPTRAQFIASLRERRNARIRETIDDIFTTIHIMNRTIVTLANGKRVANFSSPHPFTFDDGSILPGVDTDTATRLSVDFNEESIDNGLPGDIQLSFTISDAVRREMHWWYRAHLRGEVDIVLCPMPMLSALHAEKYSIRTSPFRAIRRVDRLSNIISSTKQCIL